MRVCECVSLDMFLELQQQQKNKRKNHCRIFRFSIPTSNRWLFVWLGWFNWLYNNSMVKWKIFDKLAKRINSKWPLQPNDNEIEIHFKNIQLEFLVWPSSELTGWDVPNTELILLQVLLKASFKMNSFLGIFFYLKKIIQFGFYFKNLLKIS